MTPPDEFPAEWIERVARKMCCPDGCEVVGCTGRHLHRVALAALRALRDMGALVGPDQVVVPKEATREMVIAALDRPPHPHSPATPAWQFYADIYAAMLAAAPHPGGTGDE